MQDQVRSWGNEGEMTGGPSKRILVLGCGPAGLLAAHAAVLEGHRVSIRSKKQPSFIAGAQFLHTAIEGLTRKDPDGEIRFFHIGDETGYAQKVYRDPNAPTSWSKYPSGLHGVWNMRHAYEKLWKLYEGMITDTDLESSMMPDFIDYFDAIFSTVPARVLYPSETFNSRTVWIKSDPVEQVSNFIEYNGKPEQEYYRYSYIFGNGFLEYAKPVDGATMIRKPLNNSITEEWAKTYRLGRYGRWEKGVLIDDAFREARNIAREMAR